MRFEIKHLGPVVSAEVELGDLTIIAGRNNTGKTYIVYSLYGFLYAWRTNATLYSLRTGAERTTMQALVRRFPTVAKIVRLLRQPEIGRCTVGWTDFLRDRDRYLQAASDWFSDYGINEVFSLRGLRERQFPRFSFKATMDSEKPPWDSFEAIAPDGHRASVELGAEGVHIQLLPSDVKGRVSFQNVFEFYLAVAFPDIPEPFILSAERFGISLFYKELDFTKNRLVELLQQHDEVNRREQDLPFLIFDRMASRYAIPIKHNIDYTRNIPDLRDDESEVMSKALEGDLRNLMGGYYTNEDGEIRFRSTMSKRKGSFDIPLHLASSSARGLSDLYFYLYRTAATNDLLVVDEPESHLDTANQIRLARTIARLVRLGIKVMLTTHSDYMIKEINNLIMLDAVEESARRDLGYTADERLPRDSIRAYVADEGVLVACEIDELGVEMAMFDDTIDEINRVSRYLVDAVAAPGDE